MLQWLQVFGRLHVLVLHLPIGLLVGLGAVEFFSLIRGRTPAREVTAPLAWLAAASAVLAASMGYVLSFESGYGGDTLTKHLYLGISLAGVCVITAILHARGRQGLFRSSLLLALVLLIPTGHLGGTMTHGEEFLTLPFKAEPAAPAPAPAPSPTPAIAEAAPPPAMFATAIAPILDSRCTACHGANRSKGGLALNTPEAIAKGGKHGAVINAADPGASELLRRLKLPIDHKDHMPPGSKPQPTPEEVGVIEAWIVAGASFEAPGSPAPAAPAHDHAAQGPVDVSTRVASAPSVSAPSPAPAAPVAALRSRLAHVEPVERGSNLLWVDFAAAAPTITDDDVESLLAPLKDNIADLSLSRTAISDRALTVVARMPNLRRLELRDTGVTDPGIAALRSHPHLEEIILARTRLTDAAVEDLAAMPALKRLNLWRSGITHDGAVKLSTRRDSLVIETGDRPVGTPIESEDAIKLSGDAPAPGAAPATAPSLKPQNTTCPVSGKAVDPDYVIIYRGRIIGFCCQHCAAQFWTDPAKFESALGK